MEMYVGDTVIKTNGSNSQLTMHSFHKLILATTHSANKFTKEFTIYKESHHILHTLKSMALTGILIVGI